MRGKKAKMIRKFVDGQFPELPLRAYDIKEHKVLKVIKGEEARGINYQLVLANCRRALYNEIKGYMRKQKKLAKGAK